MNNTECSPLQCCENAASVKDNLTTESPKRIHFHRRSSVGLPSIVSDNDSESEIEQERNSNTIVSPCQKADPSVIVLVNNEQ